jgi:uncharacterized membrane protein
MNETKPDKPYSMPSNVEAVVSYIPLLGSVFVLYFEKENKFVRFHAVQSLVFWFAALGVSAIINVLKLIFIGLFLEPIFQVGLVGVWFYLMYKAYNNIEYELPIIGKIAKDQVYK